MIWAFVDYENVGSLNGIELDAYQRILIFCGPKNTKINIGSNTFSEFLNIEIIKVKTNGANNLDFHIAYYLGRFSETANKEVEFHVITKDNGFNGLINHLKKTGRKCKKITMQPEIKQQKLPLSTCAELAVKRLKNIDGRKRPRMKEKLVNWIDSQCRTVDNNVDAKTILNELVNAGMVTNATTGIKYKL